MPSNRRFPRQTRGFPPLNLSFKKIPKNFPYLPMQTPERREITACLAEAAGTTHPLPDFCFSNVLLLPPWAGEM